MTHHQLTRFSVASMAALGLAMSAHATLLVHEPFDLPAGTSHVGTGSGFGWGADANWTPNADTNSTHFNILPASLSFANVAATGGALQVIGGINNAVTGRLVAFDDAMLPTGSTLWGSFLYQHTPGTDPDTGDPVISTNRRFGMDLGTAASGGTRNLRFRVADTGTGKQAPEGSVQVGSTVVNVNAPTAEPPRIQPTVHDGPVYMVIFRVENIAQGATPTDQTGTMWVLTEADFAALAASNWNPATLDTHHRQMISATASTAGSFLTGNSVVLNNRWGGGVTNFIPTVYDEIRLGTSLTGVVPIPEPASLLSLLTMGGSLMLWRRRERTAR